MKKPIYHQSQKGPHLNRKADLTERRKHETTEIFHIFCAKLMLLYTLALIMEVQAPIMIGEEVLMIFKVNRDSEAVKLKGEIAHATRWGIGVEFIAKGPQFDRQIRDIIQRI